MWLFDPKQNSKSYCIISIAITIGLYIGRMKRRYFLKSGAATGIGIAALPLAACNTNTTANQPDTTLLPAIDFELQNATIASLQQQMETGQRSSKAITQLYLDRIAAIDKAGPTLNSVIELNPDALTIADAMDAERKAGKIRSALHGIPVLIKDNIDTADKMQTTAGALALQGNRAAKDAFIITKLREAGAVLLGKTNLSEWANFRSTASCSGWSSRGGQTKSPYILTHNPCGSSAGSGTAVSADLCTLAIGTETDGSITCPASVNGIVGIKPTVGLWSRSGIIPISATQDTAGPMARTVKDAATMLGLLAGIDETDAVTKNSSGKAIANYADGLTTNGLQGRRIGVDLQKRSKFFQFNSLLDKAIEVLKAQGATVVEIDYVADINKLGGHELTILQHEFKDGVNKYLATANAPVKTLAEVIAWNKANEASAMPYFKQEQLENCEKTTGLDHTFYTTSIAEGRDASRKIIDDVIAKNQLDGICGITMGPACAIDMLYGDKYSDDFLTQPAAMSGYPHISVPMGMVFALPVGLSIFGAAWSEQKLIQMAYAYEQATQHRQAPNFIDGMPA